MGSLFFYSSNFLVLCFRSFFCAFIVSSLSLFLPHSSSALPLSLLTPPHSLLELLSAARMCVCVCVRGICLCMCLRMHVPTCVLCVCVCVVLLFLEQEGEEEESG